MTTDSVTETPPQPSRRAALGLAAAGGVALTGIAPAAAAFAAPPALPLAPVMPEGISDLAGGLELASSRAWHLARRVAPAATKAVVKEINTAGYNAWIDKQLKPRSISDAKADALVKKYLGFTNMTGKQVVKASHDMAWKAGKALSISRTVRHVFTKRYLYESMVDTMGDHLYVAAEGKCEDLVAWYDWAVLRKYALGKFSTMLYNAMRHPAMLVYLDNQLNSKDNPNENLGRELLELHTVGVGNYDETDVRQSALILTGHGYNWEQRAYHYEPGDHYTGPVTVMGFSHPNATAADGPALLKSYLWYLAHHPGTAHRIAHRLAVRYVSDNPPPALVDRLAKVYLDNGTNLAPVMRVLLLSKEFTNSIGEKWKRPQETMATMIKARVPSTLKPAAKQTGDIWAITGTVQWLLYLENHQPRMWPVVNGYPDQAPAWMGTQALLAHFYSANARVNWGNDKEFPSKSWARALGITKGMTAEAAAARITGDLTGFTWNAKHLAVVTARIKGDGPSKLTGDQITANLGKTIHFVLCSPYFKIR
ncbi:MAG TPA: DUF1800 domain-containing protein [Propionicimonas sp.]|uniref:DUF1800 domain-containing protein n=1 Tax=Propionicimonas sp. TaxID=1955623 RepID=UPI002F3F4AE3